MNRVSERMQAQRMEATRDRGLGFEWWVIRTCWQHWEDEHASRVPYVLDVLVDVLERDASLLLVHVSSLRTRQQNHGEKLPTRLG